MDRGRREDRDQRQQVRRHRRRRADRPATPREAADAGRRRLLARPAPGRVDSTRSPRSPIIGRDVPELALGVGVVPVWGRHPVAIAAQALTAAQGVPGGLTLGIGLSHPAMVGRAPRYDLYGRPTRTMREYLEVLVPLVDHRQRRPRRRPSTRARTTVALAGDRRPTVLVAAMGEQMLRPRRPPRPRHHHVVDGSEHVARPRRPDDHRRGRRCRQPAAAHRVDLPGLRDRRRRPGPRAGAPVVRVPRQGAVVRGDARTRRRGVGERRRDRRRRGRGAAPHPRAGRHRRDRPRRRRGARPGRDRHGTHPLAARRARRRPRSPAR